MEPQYEGQPQTPPSRSWASEYGAGEPASGGLAVLAGVLLLAAFFMPWVGSWTGDQSGFDIVKQSMGYDNTLGHLLLDFVMGAPVLAGLGSLILGLALSMGSWGGERGTAFRAWVSTSIGGLVALAAFWPCNLLSVALLSDATSDLKIGLWLTLLGAFLLVVAGLRGLSSTAPNYGGAWTPSLAGYGGALAVFLGVVLLLGFFLPWQEGESAFNGVTDSLGEGGNVLGELLFRLILGSTGLAGLGSIIFGQRLAMSLYSNAAHKAWAATSIGGMAALGLLLPFLMWAYALLDPGSSNLEAGFWLTLIGALLLGVASILGLVGAFATQQEEV